MKKYHVCAVGSALVDFEFEVSQAQFDALNIEKGVMTLVDENAQNQLLSKLDGIAHDKASGGSAANSMIGLGQLGGKAYFSCQLANDSAGDFYLADLLKQGIDTNMRSIQREPGTTGKCVVTLTPDAQRTMHTYLGVSESLSANILDESAIKNSHYVYLEGYLAGTQDNLSTAIAAREMAEKHGVKTAFTLSDPNMVKFFAEPVRQIIGEKVDLLFCNEMEALLFAQTQDLQIACQTLKKYARSFVITQDARGSLIYDGKQFIKIPACKVNAIDTLGAGDMYAGAFLYGITHGYSYSQAGHIASRAAAYIVSSYGPRVKQLPIEDLLNFEGQAQVM